MKLYFISQYINNGYETYDSAVVAAEDEVSARLTHPSDGRDWSGTVTDMWPDWCDAKDVQVLLISESTTEEAGVICASFNAG